MAPLPTCRVPYSHRACGAADDQPRQRVVRCVRIRSPGERRRRCGSGFRTIREAASRRSPATDRHGSALLRTNAGRPASSRIFGFATSPTCRRCSPPGRAPARTGRGSGGEGPSGERHGVVRKWVRLCSAGTVPSDGNKIDSAGEWTSGRCMRPGPALFCTNGSAAWSRSRAKDYERLQRVEDGLNAPNKNSKVRAVARATQRQINNIQRQA